MSLSMNEICKQFPNIRTATPEDNAAILEFLKTIPMDTKRFEIRYERSPDFFSLIQHQSEKGSVVVFENRDRSIGGIAVICIRRSYLNGKPCVSGYLSDLRISPSLSRETRVQWRHFYAALLENSHKVEEFNHCEYFYSAILDENKAALQAFTRDRSQVVYREIAKYNAVNLLGRFPLVFRRTSRSLLDGRKIQIRKATEHDREMLKKFLTAENQSRLFGHYFNESSGDEFDRRFEQWDGLAIENFYLAFSPEGTLLGTVCPWFSHTARRLVVARMPFYLRMLGKFLPWVGKQPIHEGTELKTLYLTHLEFAGALSDQDRISVFEGLLNRIYVDGLSRKVHLLSFIDFSTHSLMKAIRGKGYLYDRVPGTFYQVLHRSQLPTHSVNPTHQPPAFEIGIA